MLDFGAVGDGNTDNLLPFQNALNAAKTGGIGECFFTFFFLCVYVHVLVSVLTTIIVQLWPLKTYGELRCDMGPYCTVRIALYMFTHVCT